MHNRADSVRNQVAANGLREELALNREKSFAAAGLSADEIERRHKVLDELVEETERLGLYR